MAATIAEVARRADVSTATVDDLGWPVLADEGVH